MGWAGRRLSPVVGEVFCTRSERPSDPQGLLHNGYWVSLPGLKQPGRGVKTPTRLAPSLRKSRCVLSAPRLGLHALL